MHKASKACSTLTGSGALLIFTFTHGALDALLGLDAPSAKAIGKLLVDGSIVHCDSRASLSTRPLRMGRQHQIPADQGERGGVPGIHGRSLTPLPRLAVVLPIAQEHCDHATASLRSRGTGEAASAVGRGASGLSV
jgi:hypothetical protein